MNRKLVLLSLLISLILLTSCSQTYIKYQCNNGSFVDSPELCSKANCQVECPELDCSVCPKIVKEISVQTTTHSYICPDYTEVNHKEDCIDADKDGWYEVKSFSGVGQKTTSSFNIKSNVWRYTLNCVGYEDYDLYNLEIMELVNGKPSSVDYIMMSKCEENSEPSYVYSGSGDFFLDFDPVNMKSWEIIIEAKK